MKALSLAPLLTESAQMREVFQRGLAPYAESGWLVEACELRQVRRRISRRTEAAEAPYIDLCYRLDVAAPDGARSCSHWWVAQAWRPLLDTPPGNTADHAASAAAYDRARTEAADATSVAWLPAFDMVLWRLPHDPGVPTLAAFLDEAQAGAQLGAALGRPALVPTHINIVRHEPGEHCTARYTFAAGAPWRALYGKCFGDERWAPSWHTMVALACQGEDDPTAFHVPQPVACVPALRAWWQVEVRGTPLVDHFGEPAVRRRLAEALVRLQENGPPAERTLLPADLLALAHKWRKKMVRAHAAPADVLDALLMRLEELPPTSAPQTAHGDFHAGQMLLCPDGRIALFDYDNLIAASRCHDAADFVSQLLTEGHDATPRRAAEALDFLAAWLGTCTLAPCEAELDWMLRLMFLRKAYSFFVHQGEHWPLRIDRALALAAGGLQALHDEAASHSVPTGPGAATPAALAPRVDSAALPRHVGTPT